MFEIMERSAARFARSALHTAHSWEGSAPPSAARSAGSALKEGRDWKQSAMPSAAPCPRSALAKGLGAIRFVLRVFKIENHVESPVEKIMIIRTQLGTLREDLSCASFEIRPQIKKQPRAL